jgi:phage terminase large subunit GpA-like protein
MHVYESVRADYWDQITAEVKAPHRTIRHRKVWQCKSGCRNEGLDCEVYALHAARAINVHTKTPAKWDEIEQVVTQPDLFRAPAEATNVTNTHSEATSAQPARRSSSYWNR